jgi:hypothetical protein
MLLLGVCLGHIPGSYGSRPVEGIGHPMRWDDLVYEHGQHKNTFA